METVTLALVLCLSAAATIYCWRRIWRSDDMAFFKIVFLCMAAVPVLGPVLYFFAEMPRTIDPIRHQRIARSTKRVSAVMRYWLEREHLFLTGAGCIFLALAVLAYWINGWSPGEIHRGVLGMYTDVDVVFYTLLALTVLSFGGALRPNAQTQREWDIAEAQRKGEPFDERPAPVSRWWRRNYLPGKGPWPDDALENGRTGKRRAAHRKRQRPS